MKKKNNEQIIISIFCCLLDILVFKFFVNSYKKFVRLDRQLDQGSWWLFIQNDNLLYCIYCLENNYGFCFNYMLIWVLIGSVM